MKFLNMYKILIRPLEEKDSEISWRWRNDSDIWEFTGNRPQTEVTPEIERSWIKTVLNETSSRRFAITVDDRYIGNIQLTDIDNVKGEYHIFIGDKNYWGKGIAFLATQQLIRYAKNILNLENIFLKVDNRNKKAISVYRKLGFSTVRNNSTEIEMSLELGRALRPTLSIFCMVYNHEQFLKLCIEGFIMQKCDFDFEIVIGEDCSKDLSKDLLLEYAKRFPGKFKLLLHEQNIGSIKNQSLVFRNCTGKYIAICEGDDYWTDPFKLKKQVDLLEANDEVSITCHNVDTLDCRTNNIIHIEYFKEDLILDEKQIIIAGGKLTPTLSCVFRSSYLSNTPTWVFNSPVGDIPLIYYLMSKGKVYRFSQCMGVYRENVPGSWTVEATNGKKWKNFVFRVKFNVFIQKYNEYSNNRYRKELNSTYRSESTMKGLLIDFCSYFYRKFLI